MDKNAITIALPKGRMLPDCVEILGKCGISATESLESTRKLVVSSTDGGTRFLIVRDKDLPVYVDYGAADLGIVGKDVLMEARRDLLEPLDLGIGFCRIVVAQLASRGDNDHTGWGRTRVATKYPNIASSHFASRGEQVEIIPLYGSIELAPLVGLADRIVDLVSTGETLRQNGLVETDEISNVTARLVVNRASLKMRSDRIVPIIESIKKLIRERNESKI